MGKASRRKRERREGKGYYGDKIDEFDAIWEALSDAEKEAFRARMDVASAKAEEVLAPTIAFHQARLEQRIRELPPDTTLEQQSIRPAAEIYRDGAQVAEIACRRINRDDLLRLLTAAVPGFRADELVFMSDARYATVVNNPLTGREWEQDEMQDLAENHPELAKDALIDALWFLRIDRAGNEHYASRPYRLHLAEQHVEWIDDERAVFMGCAADETIPMGRLTGLVPRRLREILAMPPATEMFKQIVGLTPTELMDGNQELADANMDCAVAKLLLSTNLCTVFLLPQTAAQADVIKRSIGLNAVDIRRLRAADEGWN